MTMPVTIKTRILMLTKGVNRSVMPFINLLFIGDSKVAFTTGSITERIITIPPIHTTMAKRWRKRLRLIITRFILHLHFLDYALKPKGVEALIFATTPYWSLNLLALKFLDVLFSSCKFLLQLVSGIFQPFWFFFSRYKTTEGRTASTPATNGAAPVLSTCCMTHFSSPPFCKVRQVGRVITRQIKHLIQYLKYYLITRVKKFTYFSIGKLPLILSRTFRNSLSSSFSYFIRDAKLSLFNSCSLNLPVPLHPHVQTSFNIQRQFSNASLSIEYGIRYPFLSLLTRPACLNILKCCDTAAGVIPTSSAILFAPSRPLDFRSSIILTRVSAPKTLNISEGSVFITLLFGLIKHFSHYLNSIRFRNKFVKCFLKKILEHQQRIIQFLHLFLYLPFLC